MVFVVIPNYNFYQQFILTTQTFICSRFPESYDEPIIKQRLQKLRNRGQPLTSSCLYSTVAFIGWEWSWKNVKKLHLISHLIFCRPALDIFLFVLGLIVVAVACFCWWVQMLVLTKFLPKKWALKTKTKFLPKKVQILLRTKGFYLQRPFCHGLRFGDRI